MSISNTERRFITKVALMYHEEGMNQPQVAQLLGLPQTRVSRLLKLASELGIVRTTVVPPSDLHVDWEREISRRYNLKDVVIAEATEGHSSAVLGAAAALYLESTLSEKERLGIAGLDD